MNDLPVFEVELPLADTSQCESLASEIVGKMRPYTRGKEYEFSHFTNGITNKIFSVVVEDETFVFRVYGNNTEKLIDRTDEIQAWTTLASYGFAAPIYARFNNGIVCGFLPGKTLSVDQLRVPKIRREISRSMANLHAVVPTNGCGPTLFEKMYSFRGAISATFDDDDKQKVYDSVFKDHIDNAMLHIKEKIVILREESAFCHNDLLVHNIILSENGSIGFIDYEYAAPNFILFDLANHFCEYSGVDSPDYSLCLKNSEKLEFLYDYLKYRHDIVDDNRLGVMAKRIPLFEAAAHLFWSLWALVQAQNSTIDFDYMGYAVLRFEQYGKRLQKYMDQH